MLAPIPRNEERLAGQAEAGVWVAGLSVANWLSLNREKWPKLKVLSGCALAVEHAGRFLEEGLIHRTARGELVRSKSEVIVANMLDNLHIMYAYEQPSRADDGSVRYPDFTIDDAETGQRIYLEHLGMLPGELDSAVVPDPASRQEPVLVPPDAFRPSWLGLYPQEPAASA